MAVSRRSLAPAFALVCLTFGCAVMRGPVNPTVTAAAKQADALALSDALEALIAEGKDTPADRQFAYEAIVETPDDTAASSYARAAVTGRLVQQRGLLGANLIPDVERSAQKSRALDPGFREGAATRLLGTLYVIAPAVYLEHGDSESGLALLEGLVADHPEAPENHLRLGEAYIALGDPEPARPHLCIVQARRAELRPDDAALLDQLLVSMRGPACP